MKRLCFLLLFSLLSAALGGCVAVPYGDGYRHDGGYGHDRDRGGEDHRY
ncbi:hypothetical protein [Glaciimonas sp. PAMC28666]|nr:hypothetical protein [Glaciimonas sp. PAMC28666]QRX83716.1 hypothetical protein JQN73_05675 [Glaciimonas sp. PAMC28666]